MPEMKIVEFANNADPDDVRGCNPLVFEFSI